jgi:uncharacterized SAM-binding protein YcdF (DUF218 family)
MQMTGIMPSLTKMIPVKWSRFILISRTFHMSRLKKQLRKLGLGERIFTSISENISSRKEQSGDSSALSF